MYADDIARPVKIDIAACGAITIRPAGPLTRGLLPFFSTETREEAYELRNRLCRLERDGSGIYRVNDRPSQNDPEKALDELDALRDVWRSEYERLRT